MSSAYSSTDSSPSNSTTSSRRARATNKLINFAGLGGSRSTTSNYPTTVTTFPTFRFSPESEEMHEILYSSVPSLPEVISADSERAEGNADGPLVPVPASESLPSSPKQGETSPIKEYIRKNWTNKWDKKSLSLDLDLRGKIKTVIEDKRKSIVSHFIPEESGVVASSSTATPTTCIPEHVGEVAATAPPVTQTETTRVLTFDSSTQQVSSNFTQRSSPPPPIGSTNTHPEEYEEVGVDFLACLEQEGTLDELLLSDNVNTNYLTWSCSPESCVEKFEGVLVTIEPDPNAIADSSDQNKLLDIGFKKFGSGLVDHFLTKYFVALICVAIFAPLNSFLTAFITFICGIIFATVVSSVYSETYSYKSLKTETVSGTPLVKDEKLRSSSTSSQGSGLLIKPSPKCQGWMLQYDGPYNSVVTFHQTDPVFIHLDSSYLYISIPSPKVRIPKRKLWNDPPFACDIKFTRHLIFNVSEAQIFIAPEKLANKRVWNKKYPIGIRLPKSSYFWQVTRVREASALPGASPNDKSNESGSLPSTAQESDPTPPLNQKNSFSVVKGEKQFVRKSADGKVLYLFSRTCREKEDWFRRFINASKAHGAPNRDSSSVAGPDLEQDYILFMRYLIPNFESCLREGTFEEGEINEKKYKNKMKPSASTESEDSLGNASSSMSSPTEEIFGIESILSVPQSPTFLNALLGRLLYDAVRSPYWSMQLQNVIQRKLNFVKRPPFVELLIVKDLDLGGSFPVFQRASPPVIDSRGLWVDLDWTYEGSFCLTLETKINLMKLRKSPTNEEESTIPPSEKDGEDNDGKSAGSDEVLVGNMYDSDAEDSGESSEEEYDPEAHLKSSDEYFMSEPSQSGTSSTVPAQGRGKWLRMVEKVASSQFVSEIKMVKNAIGKMANTPLLLTVEVKEASGTLCLNIPSPPSNRVWIGFRQKPQIKLITTPRVGERSVNVTPLTDWIQRKINQQIQRVLVLPNMDDVTIKLMEFKLPS